MKTYKGIITALPPNGIFVFGSNHQGRHGKGAALTAKNKFGAIYGKPEGLQGRSWAIVTKNLTKPVHPSISPADITQQIEILYSFAYMHPELDFYVAYSGTGTNLNGYSNKEMASFFAYFLLTGIPQNMVFEEKFADLIYNSIN